MKNDELEQAIEYILTDAFQVVDKGQKPKPSSRSHELMNLVRFVQNTRPNTPQSSEVDVESLKDFTVVPKDYFEKGIRGDTHTEGWKDCVDFLNKYGYLKTPAENVQPTDMLKNDAKLNMLSDSINSLNMPLPTDSNVQKMHIAPSGDVVDAYNTMRDIYRDFISGIDLNISMTYEQQSELHKCDLIIKTALQSNADVKRVVIPDDMVIQAHRILFEKYTNQTKVMDKMAEVLKDFLYMEGDIYGCGQVLAEYEKLKSGESQK